MDDHYRTNCNVTRVAEVTRARAIRRSGARPRESDAPPGGFRSTRFLRLEHDLEFIGGRENVVRHVAHAHGAVWRGNQGKSVTSHAGYENARHARHELRNHRLNFRNPRNRTAPVLALALVGALSISCGNEHTGLGPIPHGSQTLAVLGNGLVQDRYSA